MITKSYEGTVFFILEDFGNPNSADLGHAMTGIRPMPLIFSRCICLGTMEPQVIIFEWASLEGRTNAGCLSQYAFIGSGHVLNDNLYVLNVFYRPGVDEKILGFIEVGKIIDAPTKFQAKKAPEDVIHIFEQTPADEPEF